VTSDEIIDIIASLIVILEIVCYDSYEAPSKYIIIV